VERPAGPPRSSSGSSATKPAGDLQRASPPVPRLSTTIVPGHLIARVHRPIGFTQLRLWRIGGSLYHHGRRLRRRAACLLCGFGRAFGRPAACWRRLRGAEEIQLMFNGILTQATRHTSRESPRRNGSLRHRRSSKKEARLGRGFSGQFARSDGLAGSVRALGVNRNRSHIDTGLW
jgi:hypothetical protein